MADYTPIDGETLVPDAPVIPGRYDAPVDASRIDLSVNSLIAGNAAADRVEIGPDGLRAFNESGVETATIQGGEGAFVGAEFRSSPGAEGQSFLISDTAYRYPADGYATPGIRFEDPDAGYTYPPGIGMVSGSMRLSGGRTSRGYTDANIGDRYVVFQSNPDASLPATESVQSTVRADGGGALVSSYVAHEDQQYAVEATAPLYVNGVEVRGGLAQLRAKRSTGSATATVTPTRAELQVGVGSTPTARIRADAREAYLWTTSADGSTRILSVDSDGIWAKSNASGTWKHYNLEKTAQDSGWVDLALSSAHTAISSGAAFQYRLMGNLVHLRGRVGPAGGGSYAMGGEYTLVVLPGAIRPAVSQRQIIAGGTATQWGRMDINAGTGALTIASMSGTSSWMDLTGITWTLD